MGTIMLQAGELDTPARLAYLEEIVSRVVRETRAMDLERRGLDPNVSWCRGVVARYWDNLHDLWCGTLQ
jgi:hypothetical protein